MEKQPKQDVLMRLRRIEGQIRGLQKMVEGGAACEEVLTQVAAATSAMKKAGLVMVQGYMDERDWTTYRDLSTLMFEQLTPPDLLVYVRRSTDELMERIRYRGRDYEADIPRTYVAQLNDRYDEFFEGYRYSKRLVVEADGVDYLEDPAALAEFGRQIHAKLEQTDLFIQA